VCILLLLAPGPEMTYPIPFSFDNNFKLIKRKGTIVSYGNTSGPVEPFSITKLVEKNVKLLRPT
jgi:NADPH:quinone reductase-like Zn-dependent oxidoreductase